MDHNTEERMQFYPLSSRILIVAAPDITEKWAAYVGIVEGVNHSREAAGVLCTGSKLHEDEARFFFPQYKNKNYRK